TDSSDINARFYEVLNSVAIVLKEYNQTLIDVTGHTDSTGSDQYNLELSQRRAQSVANCAKRVKPQMARATTTAPTPRTTNTKRRSSGYQCV
ncbi:MAG: hypothetical protein CL901_04310, partial [Dehalococcoidia bacterium]|nr:hypothetical protein [Dehalococcoidia bacterium]